MHPSEELKLEDMPNGYAAFKKFSHLDWFRILILVGLIDICDLQSESREYMVDYELLDTYGVPGDGSNEDQQS